MSLVSDVAIYLQTESIGTLGTNLFYSYLPANVEAGVVVLDTGGPQPDPYLPTKEPTFQVLVRAASYDAGKTKLDAVRTALHQVVNETIGSTYFYFILAMSEGGHIGLDESGRDLFSINFHCRTRWL